MSFMATNTSAPPISASERRAIERRLARDAGWSAADLRWERLSEAAIGHWQAGRRRRAGWLFHLACWQARLGLPRHDRRIATGLINLGIVAGPGTALAKRRFAAARRAWEAATGDVARMQVRPRSRSSLFHLRMEARHRDTYLANARRRLDAMVRETGDSLAALERGAAPAHRHFARWRGERPATFDDLRKLLSACLLIVDVADPGMAMRPAPE